MDVHDEKETEGENKESTVPEDKSEPSPDVMSGMKAVLIQMIKMLKEHGYMDILDEKKTEGEKKKRTALEENSDGPSPDLMSLVKAVMIQMMKKGSLTPEHQMASSKPINVS